MSFRPILQIRPLNPDRPLHLAGQKPLKLAGFNTYPNNLRPALVMFREPLLKYVFREILAKQRIIIT